MLSHARTGLALALVTAVGCGGSSAQPPATQDPTLQSGGTGPLAGLESSPFQNEVWTSDRGQPSGFLYYPRENLRVSAPCRSAAGQFVCQAMQFMRTGAPVEIAHRVLDGRTSAGVKVCMRLNQPVLTMRDSAGSEDSFCQFPDGSLVSSGALEQYKMRVVEER